MIYKIVNYLYHKCSLCVHCYTVIIYDFGISYCFSSSCFVVQRTYLPCQAGHCPCASPLGGLPVLNTHFNISNWPLFFLNEQKKRK